VKFTPLNEADIRSTQFASIEGVIDNFQANRAEYLLAVNNTVRPAQIKKAQEVFNRSSDGILQYINGFKQLPDIIKATANKAGAYTLSLKPGQILYPHIFS